MLCGLAVPFEMSIFVFSDFGEGRLVVGSLILDGTDASLDLLIHEPLADHILFAEGTFVLKHNCYYMNKL